MTAENQAKEQAEEIVNEETTEMPATDASSPQEPGFVSNEELIKTQSELAEMKDKYLRMYSEFENFRRRTSKEKLELTGTANEQLMLALLPIADDIERARVSLGNATDITIVKEGVELVFSKFFKILESKGLKALESKGKEFNVDIHEAITQIPAPSDELKGKIVDEIEKGYYLNDKLIRVAKVVTGA